MNIIRLSLTNGEGSVLFVPVHNIECFGRRAIYERGKLCNFVCVKKGNSSTEYIVLENPKEIEILIKLSEDLGE
jgi:hypothetical protein